jgi:hypothetical protein
MNCYLHTDTPAAAFCRTCGRPLCVSCQHLVAGTVVCQEHVPQEQPTMTYATPQSDPAANPYVQAPPAAPAFSVMNTSPALAFLLGLIPGVGAIYNGQYVKGLTHAGITGLLLSLANSNHGPGDAVLVLMTIAWWIYMPFEAFHTAKRRQLGIPVDEWSSLLPPGAFSGRVPVGPILLIVLGVVFLLDQLDVLRFSEIARYWPVLLIAVGAWALVARFQQPAQPRSGQAPVEAGHER